MITTMAKVKTLAALYTVSGEGVPGVATAGALGDVYMDDDSGLTYVCTDETTSAKVWAADTSEDGRIVMGIERAGQDYWRIHGKTLEEYPDGADIVGAEMALYVLGIYEGRGFASESVADRSRSYEAKIMGYPVSIVAQIPRLVSVP